MRRVTPALLLAAVAVAGCASSGGKPPATPPHRDSADRSARTVLLRGETIVIAYPHGDVRACPSSAMLDRLPPPTPTCADGLRLIGVHVGELSQTSKKRHERWGDLQLTGFYENGIFRVVSQRRPVPFRGSPFLPTPPCAAPTGGWRLTAPTEAQRNTLFDYFSLSHHRDLTSIAFFHDDTIAVVASTHPRRTREVLDRYWPHQLCVVRARYSPGLIDRVRHRLVGLLRPSARAAEYGWISEAGGVSENDRGQPITPITVLIVTPRLRAFLRRQPPGLVVVEPILRPARAG